MTGVLRLLRGEVDLRTGRGVVADRPIRLTEAQAELLAALVAASGRPVDRDALEQAAGVRSARALDLAVMRLRAKIEVVPTEPQHLLTVYGEGFRFQPAPEGPPDALPEPRSVLLGRDAELAAGRAALRRHGVVTLLGPGGVGKSALALALARGGGFARVVPLSLSELPDDDAFAAALARAVDLPTVGLRSSAEVTVRAVRVLQHRPGTLLWLDGAEHLAERVRALLSAVSAEAPHTTALITSRVRLGVPRERVIPVEPLAKDAAVALFLERARASDARLRDDDPALGPLVERLDRLPLALELAAARARSMSPAALLARLDERFRLLSDARAEDPRQRSLRATLQWSWDLLTEAERRALVGLAVFRGAVRPDAARAVLGDGAEASIAALVDHSWARRDGDAVGLLDSVREWGEVHGDAYGRAEAERRHARVHAALAKALRGDGPLTADRLDTIDAVLPELLAVGRVAPEDPGSVVTVARALHDRTHARGLHQPFLGLVDAALAALPAGHPDRAWMGFSRGSVLRVIGRLEEAAGSLAEAAALAPEALAARIASEQGALAWARGDVDASLEAFDRSLALPDDPLNRAITWGSRAVVLNALGREEEAEAGFLRAIEGAVAAGAPRHAAAARINLTVVLQRQGRLAEAEEALAQAVRDHEAAGAENRSGHLLYNLATLRAEARRYDEAVALCDEADRVWVRAGLQAPRPWAALLRAQMLLARRQPAEALEALEAMRASLERHGSGEVRRAWVAARLVALAAVGREAEAARILDEAEATGPADGQIGVLWGHVHRARAERARREGADPGPHLAEVERALEVPPTDAGIRFLLGLLRG